MLFKPGQSGNPRGRPPRPIVERTRERAKKIQEAKRGLYGQSPVDVMLARMCGEPVPDEQYRAAVDVAPYCCPKLTAIDARVLTMEVPLSDVERKTRIDELLGKLGYKSVPLIESEG